VTGAEAEYKLDKHWSLIGGFDRGWMMFEDTNTYYDALFGIKWASCDHRDSVSFISSNGIQTDGPPSQNGPNHNRFCYSLVYDHKFNDTWHYALEHNLGVEANGAPTGGDASWYGLCNYLFYTINPEWMAGMRFEWFRDNNGTRVAGVGGWIESDKGWQGAPGFAGDFYELSLGLNWRPHPNFVLRPEIRYDWYNGTDNLQGQLPYDQGTKPDQLTLATDLIFTF
jgi:hypothetical protein